MECNPLISIIIPVYNVEKYLSECIESVINQTYKNLEIILVNDGSTDSCPQICEEYAAKDNRIKVIHKKNGGLSDARNIGLKQATGALISFVDSDDLLSLDFCQRLLDALIESDADIVECDFVKFEEETEEINEVEETDFELFINSNDDELLFHAIGFLFYSNNGLCISKFLEEYSDYYYNISKVVKRSAKLGS